MKFKMKILIFAGYTLIVSIPCIMFFCFKLQLNPSDILVYISAVLSFSGTLILGILTYTFSKKVELNNIKPLFNFDNHISCNGLYNVLDHKIIFINISNNVAFNLSLNKVIVYENDNILFNTTYADTNNKTNLLPNARKEFSTNYRGKWNKEILMKIYYSYYDRMGNLYNEVYQATYQ